MNGISVKGDIHNVNTDTTHVLITHGSLTGSPLEGSNHGVLDLVQVLHSLGRINHHVGTIGVRAEAPNLTGISSIPLVLVSENLSTHLDIVTGTNLTIINSLTETVSEGLSLGVDTVVLVGRLGKTLETLNKLGQVRGVLGLNSNTHNGGDGELHHLHDVSSLLVGDSSRLEQELIDSDKTNGVTSGTVINRLDVATHHEDSALDVLDEEIVLLALDVVGTHDAGLHSSANSSREDTAKGVETSLVVGGHHL